MNRIGASVQRAAGLVGGLTGSGQAGGGDDASDAPPGSPQHDPGSPHGMHVTGERPLTLCRPQAGTPLGMVVEHTCLVNSVEEASPAGLAGMEAGMRILRIDGEMVKSFDMVRTLVSQTGVRPFEVLVSDPKLLVTENNVAVGQPSTFLSPSELEESKVDHQKARNKVRDAIRLEARSAKALAEQKQKQVDAQKFYEVKSAENRQIKEAISRSPAAQRILDLDKRLADARQQLKEDEANFQQTLSALKLSKKKPLQEIREYRALLGETVPEDESSSPLHQHSSASAFTTATSEEGMRLSIELLQIEETAEGWRKKVAELEAEDAEASADLEAVQTEIKEKDQLLKRMLRGITDLEEENAALSEEQTRLKGEIQSQVEQRNDTVRQLSEKVRNVDIDKDKHLAQANQMVTKVQGGETAAVRKMQEIDKETEQQTRNAESLLRDNMAMKAEEQNLLNRVEEAQKRIRDLRKVKKRWMEAETEVAQAADDAAKARSDTTKLHEKHQGLLADRQRFSNLIVERRQVLEESRQQHADLTAELAEKQAELARVEPLEGQVEALQASLASVDEKLRVESRTAAGLSRDLVLAQQKRARQEALCGGVQVRVARLEAQAQLVAEGLGMQEQEIEALRAEHAVELADLQRETGILQRKCERKEADLEEQLVQAEEHARVAAESLNTLEERFGEVADEPEEATVTSTPEKPLAMRGEMTFLQLTEEGAKLSETLGVIQERVWAAEQCRTSIEEECRNWSREVGRKQAELAKHWSSPEARDVLQGIAEDIMLKNVGLKDQNQRLRDKVALASRGDDDDAQQ